MTDSALGFRIAAWHASERFRSIRKWNAWLLVVLLGMVLATACTNPRRDAQVGAQVATTGQALEILNTELTGHGVHMRGVSAGAKELYWESDYFGEAAPPPKGDQAWLGRTLSYAEITRVAEVNRDALGWQVEIDASGGKVRLRLDNRESALKVRAALLRVAKA